KHSNPSFAETFLLLIRLKRKLLKQQHLWWRNSHMNVQRYARIAGVLFLVSLVAGGFGEAYIPSKLIVSGDAAATVANLKNFDFMYRLGFAAFLIESLCDITLVLILYALLKPVSKELSLLAAFFGLMGTALFACA